MAQPVEDVAPLNLDDEKPPFICPSCDQSLGSKRAIVRHCKNKHGKVPQTVKNLPGDDHSGDCPHCKRRYASVPHHVKNCLLNPSKTPHSQPEPAGEQSGSSEAELPGPSKRQTWELPPQDVPALESYISFLKDLRLKSRTIDTYRVALAKFVHSNREINPSFDLASVYRYVSPGEGVCIPLPAVDQYINRLPTPSVRSQALSALQNTFSWLMSTLECSGHRLDISLDEVDRRYNVLRRRKDQAERLFKNVKKDLDASRMREEEEMDRAGRDREIPFEVMDNLIKDYLASRKRQSFYQKLSNMKEFLESSCGNRNPHVFIRDFLMIELLVEGGGNRPEAVYNLQVQHITTSLVDSTYTKEMADGRTWRVAYMRDHKTALSLGRAQISFNDQLYKLLLAYIKDVRPLFSGNEDPQSHLFLTMNGGLLERIPTSSIEIFEEATKYDGIWAIRPNSFRHHAATWGQSHPNPEIQQNLPSRMKHSVATAQKFYYGRSAMEKKGISAHAAMMKDAQSRMPESFFSSNPTLSPELEKVRKDGQKKAQDAAKASAEHVAREKALGTFTSRQKISTLNREKMMTILSKQKSGTVTFGNLGGIVKDNDVLLRICKDLMTDYEMDEKGAIKVMWNSYRAQIRKK